MGSTACSVVGSWAGCSVVGSGAGCSTVIFANRLSALLEASLGS